MNRYIFLLLAALPFASAFAQSSTYCQTPYGVCQLKQPAGVGSSCSCSANAQRFDPGRVIPKPSSGGNLSGLCRTPIGVCQARAAPVDSACTCGGDRGRMVPSR